MHSRGELAPVLIGLVLFVVGATLLPHGLVVSATSPTFFNGQDATLVLGQPDFTSSSFYTTPNGMGWPLDIAIDPTTGKVFVADSATTACYGSPRSLRS